MTHLKSLIILLFSFLPLLVGCQEKGDSARRRITEEDLINVNRKLVNRDATIIKKYISDNKLKMTETKTGLWYMIIEKGKDKKAQKGNIISLKYHLSLLDGTSIYSSDSLGVKTFRVGQGGVETGLEEGVLMLSEGTKAKFILPPHLAHGLIGDDNKVPARAILLYDVEVIKLNDN